MHTIANYSKIIVGIKPYLVMSNGERFDSIKYCGKRLSLKRSFEKEV